MGIEITDLNLDTVTGVVTDNEPGDDFRLEVAEGVRGGSGALRSEFAEDAGFGDLAAEIEIPRQSTADGSELPSEPERERGPGSVAVEATVEKTEPDVEPGRTGAYTPDQAADKTPPGFKPDSELQRSPHYERLVQAGEAGAALKPYLYRLTVPKEGSRERAKLLRGYEGDDIDKKLVDRLGDEGGAEDNSSADQLTGILDRSMLELQERPDLIKDGVVNWHGLSTALLDRADARRDEPDFSGNQEILSSAVAAALLSPNPDDRIAFLEDTAERKLNYQVERALNQSGVSVVLDGYRDQDVSFLNTPDTREDRTIQSLRSFGTVFRAAPDEVARYRELVERDFEAPGDAHTAMKQAIADYEDPDAVLGGDNVEELEAVSVAPKNVDTYRIDPTKAERFALQEIFIKVQMDKLFPDGDVSVFQHELADLRADAGVVDGFVQLRADMQRVTSELSQGATKQFKIPEGTPSPQWTREQLAAWRYADLAVEGAKYDDIVKFVDPTVFGRPSNVRADIYSIAETGAALPDMAMQAIQSVMQMADDYEAATGDRISAGERRELLQSNRRQLMKLAAINGDNLSASFISGHIGTEQLEGRQPEFENPTTVERRPDERLVLRGPIFHRDTAETLSGARLACVALRVNVEEKPEVAGESPQKINSIELFTRIMIDEAYERGLLKSGLARAA